VPFEVSDKASDGTIYALWQNNIIVFYTTSPPSKSAFFATIIARNNPPIRSTQLSDYRRRTRHKFCLCLVLPISTTYIFAFRLEKAKTNTQHLVYFMFLPQSAEASKHLSAKSGLPFATGKEQSN
jgi:hypothetical protein